MDETTSSAPKRQILGKRNHRGQAIMRVPNQFRNTGGSSMPVFHQKPSDTEISFDTVNVPYQPAQTNAAYQLPRSIAASTFSATSKKAMIGEHSFVMNTVETMKKGPRARPTRITNPARQDLFSPQANYTTTKVPKAPRFRPSRPVQNSDQVYADIWIRILSFCEPKFLLEARTISKHFNTLLSEHSSIWRESRLNHYSTSMPDCPDDISEKQYVDLVAGRGCQFSSCPRGDTLKVHWMFGVRMCSSCLSEKTMRVDELPTQRQHVLPETDFQLQDTGLTLWELLPLARLDGRDSHPVKVDNETKNWLRNQEGNSRQYRFLKASYANLEAEYQQLETSRVSAETVKDWATQKHNKTMEHMIKAMQVDTWSKGNERQRTWDADDLKDARITYFAECAQKLSPPMDKEMLFVMADFKKILKVRVQPSERSWKALRQKIEPYRPHADLVLDYRRIMSREYCPPADQIPYFKVYKNLHDHRSRGPQAQPAYQPEQKFVIELALMEFARLENEVADEDLLLLCLKNVYDRYNNLLPKKRPIGLSYDGTNGPYRLSLDDARMIVEDILEKQIPPTSARGTVVFQTLRCRGCRRSDHVTTYSFVDAFVHILERHAMEVGEGLEYYHFAQPYPLGLRAWNRSDAHAYVTTSHKFPWYITFWPRSLPLVPRHRDPAKMADWHPAVPTEYIELGKPIYKSAFDGRRASSTEHSADAFELNLVHAAKSLYGLDLEGACQLKIALRYAVDLYLQSHEDEELPSISRFVSSLDDIRAVNTKIDLKFGCGVCMADSLSEANDNDPTVSTTTTNPSTGVTTNTTVEKPQPATSAVFKLAKNKKPIDQLEKHWALKHQHGPIPWPEGLMYLPSESDVLTAIVRSDEKLGREKDAVGERQESRAKDIKKRVMVKERVIVERRFAGEVLDELFPLAG